MMDEPIEQPDPGTPWDPRFDPDRRRPSTAEQAVPWLIGIILFLTGVIIVLLVLIFSSESPIPPLTGETPSANATSGVAGATGRPSATPSATPSAVPTGSGPIGGPAGSPMPTPTPSASPSPVPSAPSGPRFGELELAFLGRADAVAAIALLRDDFAVAGGPTTVARAEQGVNGHDWSPDGSVGAALISQRVVALRAGAAPRAVADGVAAISFGPDAETLYAVRIASAAGRDTATVVRVDFASGEESRMTELSYDRPVIGFSGPLDAAQFADEGGAVRLYWLADGRLLLSVFGGPSVAIDPANGDQTPVEGAPVLSSPDGTTRVEVTQAANGTSTLQLRDADGAVQASTTVAGVVSHLRWSPQGDRVVFTLGRSAPNGGVLQDLYLWTLGEAAPTALTRNGASFGAEWLGARESWRV